MATFEERILDFLDPDEPGRKPHAEEPLSADASSSEDLLREIAESPEKRREFEAHLRLREVLGASQKPSSAPLDVQRELAQKLPVLALHLPYLAEKKKRNTLAAFWQSQTSLVRVGSMIGGLALLASLIYLFGISSHQTSTSSFTGRTRSSNAVPNAVPDAVPNASVAAARDITSSSASAVPNARITNAERSNAVDGRTAAPRSVSSGALHDGAHFQRAGASPTRGGLEASIEGSQQGAMQVANADVVAEPSAMSTSTIGPIGEVRLSRPVRPSVTIPNDRATQRYTIEIPSESQPLLTAWVAPQLRVRFLPTVSLPERATSSAFTTLGGTIVNGSYWIGVDHAFENGWTFGVRAGRLSVARMQTYSYSEPTPGYPLLRRYSRATRIVDTTALVFGPGVGFSAMFFGSNVNLSGFAGFGGGVNWVGGVDLNLEYPLSEKLSIRTAAGFDLTSSGVAAASGEVLPSTFTLGLQQAGAAPSTMLVPALSVSIGVTFRP